MKAILRILLLIVSLAIGSLVGRAEQLVFCGWDEVFIYDLEDLNGGKLHKIWSWRAEDRNDLPTEFRSLFKTTDECKPVGGGRLLISSSGGAAAVVERATGRVSWYGRVGNAHSIELLPENRVVVAGSTHTEGDRLAVFDLGKPNEAVFAEDLHSGHGVVWDERRQLLWALGYDELRAYRLADWQSNEPKLALEKRYSLPTESGHDLSMMPDGGALLVTTHQGVYTFNVETGGFSDYGPLQGRARVKGVSIHPLTGRVAFIQAEGENWWTPRVHFLNPPGELRLENERLYKVRWVIQ